TPAWVLPAALSQSTVRLFGTGRRFVAEPLGAPSQNTLPPGYSLFGPRHYKNPSRRILPVQHWKHAKHDPITLLPLTRCHSCPVPAKYCPDHFGCRPMLPSPCTSYKRRVTNHRQPRRGPVSERLAHRLPVHPVRPRHGRRWLGSSLKRQVKLPVNLSPS